MVYFYFMLQSSCTKGVIQHSQICAGPYQTGSSKDEMGMLWALSLALCPCRMPCDREFSLKGWHLLLFPQIETAQHFTNKAGMGMNHTCFVCGSACCPWPSPSGITAPQITACAIALHQVNVFYIRKRVSVSPQSLLRKECQKFLCPSDCWLNAKTKSQIRL